MYGLNLISDLDTTTSSRYCDRRCFRVQILVSFNITVIHLSDLILKSLCSMQKVSAHMGLYVLGWNHSRVHRDL